MTDQSSPKQFPEIGTNQIALLERLSNALSVSGDEGEVRSIVLEEIRELADDLKIDAMGNILVTRKSIVENPLRVMVAAHMDEVGFMLVDDEGDGIYKFEIVGGIDNRQLAGKPVIVGKNKIPGVIGAKPIHFTNADERKSPVSVESLRIDIGPAGSKKVKVGDRAGFATRFFQSGPALFGKALDDRLGVATLIEFVKNPPENVELLAAFTVQEELGLRGARIAAFSFDPDAAFVIDSTPANDLPVWDDEENSRYNVKIDQGPAIYRLDAATLSDPRLIELLVETATELKIPYQFRQPGRGGTDAGAIHKQRGGIPSVSISVPGRYAHTAVMMAHLQDWQNSAALVHAAINRLSRQTFLVER
jgi:putative aminopeptidase FrvX